VVVVTFPHQIFGCFMVGGAFMAGIAGWHLWRSHHPYVLGDADDRGAWRTAIKIGAVTLLIASLGVAVSGDLQGKVMTEVQPMKMAAAEALYDTEQPASFSVITIGTPDGQQELWAVKVPKLLSFLATGTLDGQVQGIRELQSAYEATYGPGSYAPNIPLTYWTFRWMIALGMAGAAAGLFLLWSIRGQRDLRHRLWLPLLVALPLLPLCSNSLGWIFTETGRQPWLVFGLLPTAAGVSPGTTVAEVLTSMATFTFVYGALAVIEVRLMLRYIRAGLPDVTPRPAVDDGVEVPLEFSY
jgi:cytochrome d ubiquinol oxidase subunit I